MTSTAFLATPRDEIRAARAEFVRQALKADRWSVRAAALAIGTSHTALGARVKGDTAFLAEDIELIAILLKRNPPVEFYGAYLRAGTQEGPASEETGPVVHPLGLEPRTH